MQQYRPSAYRSSQNSRLGRLSSHKLTRAVLVSKLLKWVLIGIIAGSILFFLYFLWVSRSLPTPGQLSAAASKDSTVIKDKNGTVLYSLYEDVNRLYVPLKDIPKITQQATISTEDKDFYSNKGFSVIGLARGLIIDPIFKGRATGGSTITQQLVKNLLLSPERSPTRKLNELILAIQASQRYTKDEVLELYLNNVPYGGNAVGIEAASNMYFDKSAKELTLAESAFLAGLPQLPSRYSPYTSTDKAYIKRSEYVLNRMVEDRKIDRKEADDALKKIKNFKFPERQANLKAPHFVQYVREQLVDLFGDAAVARGDLQVTTTLDYDIQNEAEKIVDEEIDKLDGLNVGNGAAIVLDPKTGAILAMIGSRNYFDTQHEGNFNASISRRQPGSSLKPIMYATALEKGYTAATLLFDAETEFPGENPAIPSYKPVNYDGEFRGPVQLRFALGNSLNVPAVKMLAQVGLQPVMKQAYAMGIENWEPTESAMRNVGLSLVLGGREASLLEITSAYSALANKGTLLPPFSIEEVKDSRGKTLYKNKRQNGVKVLDEGVAFIISHILLDDNARSDAFGRYSKLNISGKTVSVKTGTTDQKRDNWAVGYTPSYVTGVWVGNNDNTPMNPKIASGTTGATPIWNRIMTAVLKNVKNEEFKIPGNVTAVEIDSYGGGLPVDGQSKRTEYFIKGTEPTSKSPIYKQVKISKSDSNKLANSEEISKGDYDVKEYIVFSEKDPVSKDERNRWQEAIDAWINEHYKDDSKYHPPGETSDKKYDSNSEDEKEPTLTLSLTPTP